MQDAYKIPESFGKEILSAPPAATALEYLETSRSGAYSASTISGCHTRKYHGLLVAPQPQIDEDNHVLLAALDEMVTGDGSTCRLSTHRYKDVYYPEGYRYMEAFTPDPVPTWTFRLGNMVLKKELQFVESGNILMIRYTVTEAGLPLTLCLLPLLSFRNVHTLCKADKTANTHFQKVAGGVSVRLHAGYTPVYVQLSTDADFIAAPDWYYGIEYPEEQRRGYDCHEDVFTPGYFIIQLKKGQSVILAAGSKESRTETYAELFNRILEKKSKPQSMEAYLQAAAHRFIVQSPAGYSVKAGYYWFGTWGRDTAISLPGLTLMNGQVKDFLRVTDAMIQGLKDGLLPNSGSGSHAVYNSADASLWFVWSLQQYVSCHHNAEEVWCRYGDQLRTILDHYKKGTCYGIRMDADTLIHAAQEGFALTWMDAIVDGIPVTPRYGKAVEINALWHNAVCFCLEIAAEAADDTFIREWREYPDKIRRSFIKLFWDDNKGYLADCVDGGNKDWSVRPNQLFAVSLPYSPLTAAMQTAVVDIVRDKLLTPRGLRTLSPDDTRYCGNYGGDQRTRDQSYHQGTVWPWLLGHFGEAYLRVYGHYALPLLEGVYNGMAPALHVCCLYNIPELFDGDFPYKAGGAVAQAMSVAELIRLKKMIDQYRELPVDGQLVNMNSQFGEYY